MNNILVIAPYEALVEQAERMNEICDIPYTVIPGNLKENLDEIRSYINLGVKILISRGGTAQALRNSFDLPVIEIPVTSVDILMALSKASEQGFKKIAFITTLNILFQAKHFNNIMDLDLQILPCQDANEIPAKVQHLIEDQGIDAVVGDVVATQQAIERGIYGCLLESGPMSLQIALNEAATILKSMEKEKARLKQLEAILNFTTEAVLTIDNNEKVTVYNASAERIFGVPINQVLGNKLTECLPESLLNKVLSEHDEEKNILLKIKGKKIVCNRVPIIIHGRFHGAVAIFQEIGEIQNLEMNIRTRLNEKGLVAKKSFNDIQGGSAEMLKCILQARQYAKSNGTVLIYGETGTGKELFAQSIHNESKRAKGPFVSVNCAALSENLLESELFGYVEGTFTGALKGGKMGLFELAHGGTLFLDELGEISLNFQAKLLRVLQEKEVRRVGGDRVTPIDVRIICATNRDLHEEVQLGRFREDLYYRLSVLELQLMPLRQRKDDIVPMAISFFKSECIKEQKVLFLQQDQLFDCLKSYDWFGNARELQNFIERLVISTDEGEEIREYKICEMLAEKKGKLYDRGGQNQDELQVTISKRFEDMENQLWRQLLERYHGNKDRLCKDFGISKTTLWRKLNFHK
ncbi:sigma 54-interacting transcriptional regulator [Neobacillus cucumis]|uniref:sigma 54-interacting transcriptional regulator n=1 Tax=Neobacillus cucumis TaxID=1740721 RepID=UPI002853262B|nr:sigma 54-interacting transcriptional regulator [Neobacillus cucumis]MDR4945232.1 sigma 54-interacting transcriptional regulator [Neobacillus cucumis]